MCHTTPNDSFVRLQYFSYGHFFTVLFSASANIALHQIDPLLTKLHPIHVSSPEGTLKVRTLFAFCSKFIEKDFRLFKHQYLKI